MQLKVLKNHAFREREITDELRKSIKETAVKAVAEVHKLARIRAKSKVVKAPGRSGRATGRLRNSLHSVWGPERLTFSVGTKVPYAVFIEFGTFNSETGRRSKKQPFLMPAFYAARNKLLKKFPADMRKKTAEIRRNLTDLKRGTDFVRLR